MHFLQYIYTNILRLCSVEVKKYLKAELQNTIKGHQ